MAYTKSFSFKGDGEGRQGVLLYGTPPKFSEVFNGQSVFYPGSTVQVEETMTIISNINKPELLRQEDRWFIEKKYLGTWQRITTQGLLTHNNTDYGLIRDTTFSLNHYSTYTIGADPNNPIQQHDGGSINQCNFEIQQVTVGNPPLTATFGRPALDNDLFKIDNYQQPCRIQDTEYNLWWGGVGIFFYDGIEGFRVDFRASVINVIFNGNDKWQPRKCTLGAQSCAEAFDQLVRSINGGRPIDTPGGDVFSTRTTNDPNSPLYNPVVFPCPIAADGSYTYYVNVLSG